MPPKKKRNYDPSENDESDELESVENGLGKRKQITKAKKFRKKPQDELNRIMKSRE